MAVGASVAEGLPSATEGRGGSWPGVSVAPTFVDELILEVGEEAGRLLGCLQCGTCSSACPLAAYMDLTPRRLIGLVRAGAREAVLGSRAPWVCASCYACTMVCPKRIPITEIMHGLRRISMRKRTFPRRFPTPVMSREFVSMVARNGRSTESLISLKLYLKTDPLLLVRNARTALRLLRQGRLKLRPARIRGRRELRTLLDAATG